jgi:hypothetical protein
VIAALALGVALDLGAGPAAVAGPGPEEPTREPGGTPTMVPKGESVRDPAGVAPRGVPRLEANEPAARYCETDGVAVVSLGEAGVDSLCLRMTAANDAAWDRTDSLFSAGYFGAPSSAVAREKAATHFLLRSRHAFDYLADLGCAARTVRVNEGSLSVPFSDRYANTNAFPVVFLREGLVGRGGFCLSYDIHGKFDRRTKLGGVALRVRNEPVEDEEGNKTVPGLSVEFLSRIHKSVDLLYLARFCGRIERETIIDRGDTLELVIISGIEGMYARKAGNHPLQALVTWRSMTHGDRDPARPRSGACAYFPRFQIQLRFLPDLGLEDLRDFNLPSPVVALSWVRSHPSRPWMKVTPDAFYEPWETSGPRPLELDRRFPDL